MAIQNHHGQILIEVCVVISLIFLIAFTAITELSEHKRKPTQYHFTKDLSYEQKNYRLPQK